MNALELNVQPSAASDQPAMAITDHHQEQKGLNILEQAESHDTTPSTNNNYQKRDNEASNFPGTRDTFPILSLPLELRLKIYSYILPARHHKIVTSIPPTNFFYNTSAIPNNTSYPFGHSAPLGPSGIPLPVPYKVLTKNTHTSYPYSSITTALLQTCKQIHAEAEPVLYGSNEAVWDFGVHLEALRGFWGERSSVARASVRSLRVAYEVPVLGTFEAGSGGEMLGRKAAVWQRMINVLKEDIKGLRELDLTIWCSDGSESGFPPLVESSTLDVCTSTMAEREVIDFHERQAIYARERRWREWKWTEELLCLPSLRQTKITCWAALPPKMEDVVAFGVTVPKFDSWVAGRMVADAVLREKMVKDGVVVSEEVVSLGSTANWVRSRSTGANRV